MSTPSYSIEDLLAVMARLRDPQDGCPWDLEQTPLSLAPYTLEESYELLEALEKGDTQDICAELGDLLLQIVFHCQFARERGDFEFADVVSELTDKLMRRHPHVFQADQRCADSTEVEQNWEQIKQQERSARQQHGLLDDIPMALPALLRARKLQKRAAKVNFDFKQSMDALAQLKSEVMELEEVLNADDCAQQKAAFVEELGDVLFSCVNIGRRLGVCAEDSLRASNRKFQQRMTFIEQQLAQQDKDWQQLTEKDREALWQLAKKQQH